MRAHQVRSYGPGVSENDGSPCLPQYEIRVTGHLGSRWAAWFDGLELTPEDDGTTALRGPVADQAALHGLLQKLRDIGIPLVSLRELAADAPTDLPDHPITDNPSGATP